MKKNKMIMFLGIAILFVVLIDFFLVLKKHGVFSQFSSVPVLEKQNKEYICNTNSRKISFKNSFDYEFHNEYRFVLKENVIIYGELSEILQFSNEEDYAFFLENDDVEVQFEKKEDEENLRVIFSKSMFLDTDENSSFQEDYLRLLENKGFYCK